MGWEFEEVTFFKKGEKSLSDNFFILSLFKDDLSRDRFKSDFEAIWCFEGDLEEENYSIWYVIRGCELDETVLRLILVLPLSLPRVLLDLSYSVYYLVTRSRSRLSIFLDRSRSELKSVLL